jgi:hypothetical protein
MENIILKFIGQNIKGVDTYQHNGSNWLIFTDEKKWVIELTKDGTLWYNYNFFNYIFSFFSLDVIENQRYITKWVEDTIQNGVKNTSYIRYYTRTRVEDTIQNGVKNTYLISWDIQNSVKNIIQNGIKELKELPDMSGNLMGYGDYYNRQEDRTKPHTKYVDDAISQGEKY